MVKKFVISVFLLLTLPFFGFAQLTANPSVVDQTARIRDNFTFSLLVENEGDSTARFYPVLANFLEEGGTDFNSEKSNEDQNLTDFLQLERGRFQLKSGETERLDLTIDIPVGVKPGTYYGKIIFSKGSTRKDAEENAQNNNYPEVFVRVKVVEGIVENAQLKNFTTDKDIFLTSDVRFSTQIQNIGNREIKPDGSIFIYKERNNREVGVVDINSDQETVKPQEEINFENLWKEGGFGKYKAVLRAEYGEKTIRDLQGTIYFWILPWPLVLIFTLFVLGLTVTLIILIKKLTERAQLNG